MWLFRKKGPSGFSSSSTAEEVTQGIDGTGLTAIVTGASSGIGAETTRVLSLCGLHVVMGVRNIAAGTKVKEAIVNENPNVKLEVMELDLSSMASVKKFVSKFISAGLPLNILINNAGVMANPFMLSHDSIEMQFATNHIGHFLLTNLLLGTMKTTAQQSNVEGRIVIVSSEAHQYSKGIRFDNINEESGYHNQYAYQQSKLANVLHANELARHLKEVGVQILANSLHPGLIATDILRHSGAVFSGLFQALAHTFGKNIQQGAATTCYVALHPQVKGVSSEYFVDCNLGKASALATDMELAKRLLDFSMSLIS